MKKIVNVGDEFEVTFLQGNSGKPIARIGGKVCLINNDNHSLVITGAQYIVRVDEVKETCMVITPLVIWKTKEQVDKELERKLEMLKTKKRPRIKKVKSRTPIFLRNGKNI